MDNFSKTEKLRHYVDATECGCEILPSRFVCFLVYTMYGQSFFRMQSPEAGPTTTLLALLSFHYTFCLRGLIQDP